MNITITFILVNIAWIFFRANSIEDAFHIIGRIFSKQSNYFSLSQDVYGNTLYLGYPLWLFTLSFLLIPLLFILEFLIEKNYVVQFDTMPKPFKWAVYYAFIVAILITGVFNTNQFIYFQF